MATAKSAGAAKYGRDSNPKYLGIKLHDGERARAGSIIVRQRGRKYFPGKNVRVGGDDTLYAAAEGFVRFATRQRQRFDGSKNRVNVVNVIAPA